jgi:phosphoribosylformylglycinamidine cyclo-ligase
VKRSKVIDNANIKAGDVIVGLASLGSQPMRKVCNGVRVVTTPTSARHDVFKILGNQVPGEL